jgi:hypothetical protein
MRFPMVGLAGRCLETQPLLGLTGIVAGRMHVGAL